MDSSLFSRTLEWLYKAFKLEEPRVPQRLATELLQPIVDVGQGGIPFAEVENALLSIPAATAGAVYDIFQNSFDEQSLVSFMRLSHGGGAGAASLVFRVSERNPVGGSQATMLAPSLAIGADLSTVDLFGGASNLTRWVPPDWKFQVSVPTTIAAETFEIRTVRVKFPRGFKPW